MRELSVTEVESTAGGILPLIAGIVLVDVGLIGVTMGIASGAEKYASESPETCNISDSIE